MLGLTQDIKKHAAEIGFCSLGITNQHTPKNYKHYLDWVKRGYHQNMWYLAEDTRKRKRESAAHLLPSVQSILVGAVSYHQEQDHVSDAKFARYGWGLDYHDFVKDMFQKLRDYVKARHQLEFDAKIIVDTAPILERDFAKQAGIGWIGKNTMVMNQKDGSYIYLGMMLTSLDLVQDQEVSSHCGTCTACIDACPTDAIEAPYHLNPAKCIAYHTIENKDEDIPESIKPHLQGWVAGCDICQEVCPWNNKAQISRIEQIQPRDHTQLGTSEILALTEEVYAKIFSKTSFSRLGHKKLLQNAKSALDAGSSRIKKEQKA